MPLDPRVSGSASPPGRPAAGQPALLGGCAAHLLKGDVRLTGVLETQQQIDEALRLARAAEGAHTIHDELSLKR